MNNHVYKKKLWNLFASKQAKLKVSGKNTQIQGMMGNYYQRNYEMVNFPFKLIRV